MIKALHTTMMKGKAKKKWKKEQVSAAKQKKSKCRQPNGKKASVGSQMEKREQVSACSRFIESCTISELVLFSGDVDNTLNLYLLKVVRPLNSYSFQVMWTTH